MDAVISPIPVNEGAQCSWAPSPIQIFHNWKEGAREIKREAESEREKESETKIERQREVVRRG